MCVAVCVACIASRASSALAATIHPVDRSLLDSALVRMASEDAKMSHVPLCQRDARHGAGPPHVGEEGVALDGPHEPLALHCVERREQPLDVVVAVIAPQRVQVGFEGRALAVREEPHSARRELEPLGREGRQLVGRRLALRGRPSAAPAATASIAVLAWVIAVLYGGWRERSHM